MNQSLSNLPNEFWYSAPLEDTLNTLGTRAQSGLTLTEVAERRRQYGSNELPHGRQKQWWEFLLSQFQSPLVYILLVAAVLTTWLQEVADTVVIIISVLVNTIIGFSQEYQSNQLLQKLKTVIRVEALVVRQGHPMVVPGSDLVLGDVILLKTGARVPADARLLEAHDLETGESILTGESMPVPKAVRASPAGTSVGDRSNMVWMGTMVEQGAGRAIVVATGARSELGRIAALSSNATEGLTPLQERLQHLANLISGVVAVSAVVIVVLGLFERLSFVEVFTTAVAVAVAAIPEGLAAALSVVLAVSTWRILQQQGLVRRPVAAETLGSTTIICTDKTGTLTEGVMKLEALAPDGLPADAHLVLALANEAIIEHREGQHVIHGEATDRAKLAYVIGTGVGIEELASRYPERAVLPFDMVRKYVAAFRQDAVGGGVRCFVSGAPEVVLARATEQGKGGVLTPELRASWVADAERLAAQGYRVIALADRRLPEGHDFDDGAKLHKFIHELTFRGLAALRDPIRSDVPETLAITRRAGVRIMMITGDHRLTAVAIGRELGFRTGEENVVDGTWLDQTSDAALAAVMPHIDICVRVNPEHKLRIVKALRANGEAVAMTGDGINDAPALKAADIGVAVGSATDVTKEAADLVLLNDSLTTIASAIREGRIAFDNIRKSTVLLISGSFTAFLLVMTSLVFGIPLPLTAVQILWGNLIVHGLPTFALAFEPGESDVMQRPPIRRGEPVLDWLSNAIVLGIAPLRDAVLVTVFLWLYWYGGYALDYVRTIIFAMISTGSLFYVFSIKSFRRPIWREHLLNNPFLVASIAVGLAMIGLAIYVPLFNRFLATVPLSFLEVLLVLSLAMFNIVLIELVKLYARTRSTQVRLAQT